MNPASTCRACHAPIFWAITDKGRRIPLNVAPRRDGNVLISRRGGVTHASVLSRVQAAGARASGKDTYTSHFADCPRASTFRKDGSR